MRVFIIGRKQVRVIALILALLLAGALQELFTRLSGRYQFVSLKELLPQGDYKVNFNGTAYADLQ